MINQIDVNSVNSVSQLIQLSVAPVFLLAGLAGLLNVFTSRLSRIIDKIDRLDKFEKENESLNDDLILSEKIKQREDIQWLNINLINIFYILKKLKMKKVNLY